MKTFEGIILSVGMNRTAVVEITRKTPHPLYKKLIKRSKNFKADTAGFELAVGMRVKIVETRPISKNKFFKVSEIVSSKVVKISARTERVEEVKEDVVLDKKLKAKQAKLAVAPTDAKALTGKKAKADKKENK